MNKTIKDFSVVELKALAYDFIGQFETARKNLEVVNAELKLREEAPKTEATPAPEEVK